MLNTFQDFKAARKVLIDYGNAEMLFREHVRDDIAKPFDEETKDWEKGQLTTTMQRFNPFALLVDGHPAMTKGQDATPGLADSNKCMDTSSCNPTQDEGVGRSSSRRTARRTTSTGRRTRPLTA